MQFRGEVRNAMENARRVLSCPVWRSALFGGEIYPCLVRPKVGGRVRRRVIAQQQLPGAQGEDAGIRQIAFAEGTDDGQALTVPAALVCEDGGMIGQEQRVVAVGDDIQLLAQGNQPAIVAEHAVRVIHLGGVVRR